jgi:hypothetical protein
MKTAIEDRLDELGCKVFLEAGLSQPDLVGLLSDGASAQVTRGPSSALVMNDIGELELRRNDDGDAASAREYPDGFLHFRYVIEFYPRPTASREDQVDYIGRLLDRLWSSGLPAVASCDYEDELPHHGGYRDASLPWPSQALNGLADVSSYPKDLGSRSPG